MFCLSTSSSYQLLAIEKKEKKKEEEPFTMQARIGEHGNYITKEAMLQKKKNNNRCGMEYK